MLEGNLCRKTLYPSLEQRREIQTNRRNPPQVVVGKDVLSLDTPVTPPALLFPDSGDAMEEVAES